MILLIIGAVVCLYNPTLRLVLIAAGLYLSASVTILKTAAKHNDGSADGIPPCPPHTWSYGEDGYMFCGKCKKRALED